MKPVGVAIVVTLPVFSFTSEIDAAPVTYEERLAVRRDVQAERIRADRNRRGEGSCLQVETSTWFLLGTVR